MPDSDQQQSAYKCSCSLGFPHKRLAGYLLSFAKFMLGSKSNAVWQAASELRQSFSMPHMAMKRNSHINLMRQQAKKCVLLAVTLTLS